MKKIIIILGIVILGALGYLEYQLYKDNQQLSQIEAFYNNTGATAANMDIGAFDQAVYFSINRLNAAIAAQKGPK